MSRFAMGMLAALTLVAGYVWMTLRRRAQAPPQIAPVDPGPLVSPPKAPELLTAEELWRQGVVRSALQFDSAVRRAATMVPDPTWVRYMRASGHIAAAATVETRAQLELRAMFLPAHIGPTSRKALDAGAPAVRAVADVESSLAAFKSAINATPQPPVIGTVLTVPGILPLDAGPLELLP